MLVNDLHSALNATRVARLIEPTGLESLVGIVKAARAAGAQLSVCGGRHAMGGQQFGTDTWLLDLQRHAAIRELDEARGLIQVDAGIQWPDIIRSTGAWGIRQKQTGADRLTLGGALAANIHGRGLRMPPIVLTLVPKVSAALWERMRKAKLRFGGWRQRPGTAGKVAGHRKGDGLAGTSVPKALR